MKYVRFFIDDDGCIYKFTKSGKTSRCWIPSSSNVAKETPFALNKWVDIGVRCFAAVSYCKEITEKEVFVEML